MTIRPIIRTWGLLLLIVVLFLATRLYRITDIPASLYWDEASIGYNAYSILKTGHDEWGTLLPLNFRAFGEFKLPVYIYSTVISEKIFGINDLAVRLPAVFFSLGIIILTYLIVKNITNQIRAGLLSAFLLAISPWLFIFSRTGFEATAGLMFYLLGIHSFLRSFKVRAWMVFSALAFGLSLYSYNSFRILVPLSLPILIFYLYRTKKLIYSNLLLMVVSGLIMLFAFIPIIRFYLLNLDYNRFQTVSITQNYNGLKTALVFVQNYLSHFSPAFLFINGDTNLRIHVLGLGQLYWLDLPFLILGIIYLYQKKSLLYYLPLIFLLLSPIPASLTIESPHALRSISAAPFLVMITTFGFIWLEKRFKYTMLLTSLLILSYFAFFIFYFYNFISVYPIRSDVYWQYGYKALFSSQNYQGFDQVVVSDYLAQPYIFALWYTKYDPLLFQKEVKYNPPDKWGFSTVASFGKFHFQPVSDQLSYQTPTILFAGPKESYHQNLLKNAIINLNGTEAFRVYATK